MDLPASREAGSADDSASQTSTELYDDHEPFEKFRTKVEQLCHELWPGEKCKFLIQKMIGGSDNRIVGLTVSLLPDQDIEPGAHPRSRSGRPELPMGKYVLRIPRSRVETFEHDSALLGLAAGYLAPSGIGVPTILDFDKESSNALGQPYCLQRWISGSRLDLSWDGLNVMQKEQLAFELGRMFKYLHLATNTSGGIPNITAPRRADGEFHTHGFPFPEATDGAEYPKATDDADCPKATDGAEYLIDPKPPKALVLEMIERWHQMPVPIKSPWPGIAQIVDHGTPNYDDRNREYFFCHGDLFPRNILVKILSVRVATITAILDWDCAHFAPKAIAFTPPSWLWIKEYWQDDDQSIPEEETWSATTDPQDPDSQLLKSIFDNWLPAEIEKAAYAEHAPLARKIWAAVSEVWAKSWIYRDLERTYEAWEGAKVRLPET